MTRSNGVNTTLIYDNADRLTGIRDDVGAHGQALQAAPLLDLRYTLDAAGQVTQLQMTAPLDPGDDLVGQVANLSYDAASQISTAGYTYDARGRQTAAPGTMYTWDDGSRLTGINSTALTYNGLNDVRTRTAGDATTHYYYNYALGLTPIVAEAQESGDREQGSGVRSQGSGVRERDAARSALLRLHPQWRAPVRH
jgi:hypothetical protein